MASDEHIALLMQGVAAWNTFNVGPDLSEANSIGANLSEADLVRANLSGGTF
jgi:uncharacterized protein YjbI with pentapeptide repeats